MILNARLRVDGSGSRFHGVCISIIRFEGARFWLQGFEFWIWVEWLKGCGWGVRVQGVGVRDQLSGLEFYGS